MSVTVEITGNAPNTSADVCTVREFDSAGLFAGSHAVMHDWRLWSRLTAANVLEVWYCTRCRTIETRDYTP